MYGNLSHKGTNCIKSGLYCFAVNDILNNAIQDIMKIARVYDLYLSLGIAMIGNDGFL